MSMRKRVRTLLISLMSNRKNSLMSWSHYSRNAKLTAQFVSFVCIMKLKFGTVDNAIVRSTCTAFTNGIFYRLKCRIKNTNSTMNQVIYNWSCPKCNLLYSEEMPNYLCFCAQELNPEFNRYIIPHACGKQCAKKRGKHCTHPCPIDCHPGPCPECTVKGLVIPCFCGKNRKQVYLLFYRRSRAVKTWVSLHVSQSVVNPSNVDLTFALKIVTSDPVKNAK